MAASDFDMDDWADTVAFLQGAAAAGAVEEDYNGTPTQEYSSPPYEVIEGVLRTTPLLPTPPSYTASEMPRAPKGRRLGMSGPAARINIWSPDDDTEDDNNDVEPSTPMRIPSRVMRTLTMEGKAAAAAAEPWDNQPDIDYAEPDWATGPAMQQAASEETRRRKMRLWPDNPTTRAIDAIERTRAGVRKMPAAAAGMSFSQREELVDMMNNLDEQAAEILAPETPPRPSWTDYVDRPALEIEVPPTPLPSLGEYMTEVVNGETYVTILD